MSELSFAELDRLPATFLIVDDDEICVMALRRAIKQQGLINPVRIASDGLAALQHLQGVVEERGRLPPYIVMLDLSMPRMGGLEFLERVRADPSLKRLVVFVLTTSDARSDIDMAYENHVAGYIVKADATATFRNTVELLSEYSKLIVLPA